MEDKEFLLKELENLQEEIKRLKKLNKNTIRIQVNFDGRYYEVDTQIPAKLKEMNYYYLADDYKNPSKVKFMNYEIASSIDNKIIICARVLDEEKDEFMFYFSEKLFESKSRASDFYLANRSNNANRTIYKTNTTKKEYDTTRFSKQTK